MPEKKLKLIKPITDKSMVGSMESKKEAVSKKDEDHMTYEEWEVYFKQKNQKGEELMTKEQFIKAKQAEERGRRGEKIKGIASSIMGASSSVGRAVVQRVGENFEHIQGFSDDGGGFVQQQVKGMSSSGVRERIQEEIEPRRVRRVVGKRKKR